MASTGLGKCALCHRTINDATPIRNVTLGRPPRAYLCHAGCAKDAPEVVSYTVDGRGQLEPPYLAPQSSDEVQVVTSLGDFMPEISDVVASEPTPAMPVKEQVGRRRGRPPKKAQ
jgi:hypothetical protein